MTQRFTIKATKIETGNFRIDIKGKFSQADLVAVCSVVIKSQMKQEQLMRMMSAPITEGVRAAEEMLRKHEQ